MSERKENETLQFYTVCFPEYDSWSMFHGRLYQVRRDFLETHLASQESAMDFSEGVPAKYSHSISRFGMRWKKKLGGRVREVSCTEPGGSAILLQDSDGCVYGRLAFGKDLNWKSSTYYRKGSAARQVRFLLEGDAQENGITLTEYPEQGEPIVTRLLARPFLPGTVEQSLINAHLGQARVYAATSGGDFSYYEEAAAREYDLYREQIQAGGERLAPVWTQEVLPERIEPDWTQRPQDEPQEDTALPALEALGSLRERLLEEAQEDGASQEEAADRQDDGAQEDEAARYPVSREVFHAPEPAADPDPEVQEIIRIIESLEQKNEAERQAQPVTEASLRQAFPTGALPQRYIVAGKTLHTGVIRASDLSKKAKPEQPVRQEGPRCIVVSAQDSDGSLPSTLPQGAGIAYTSEDGTLFVGNWKNSIPTGEGLAFDPQGHLLYTGQWKEGKRHGFGTEFAPDGRILFTGQWENGARQGGLRYQSADPAQVLHTGGCVSS